MQTNPCLPRALPDTLLYDPGDRGITSELYGGGPEMHLQQEMALGIAGWRLLEKLDERHAGQTPVTSLAGLSGASGGTRAGGVCRKLRPDRRRPPHPPGGRVD